MMVCSDHVADNLHLGPDCGENRVVALTNYRVVRQETQELADKITEVLGPEALAGARLVSIEIIDEGKTE